MALLPESVPTGLVTGTMYFVNEDSVDPDTNPEYTVVTGSVVFTANLTGRVLRMVSEPAVLVPIRFEGIFNSEGKLVPKNGTGIGMELIATDSALLNPRNWTWTCTFDFKEAGTPNTINIPSFDFQVATGSVKDLSELMPVAASGGVLTLQGSPGKSAYEVAVSDGFEGTEAEWLASLQGPNTIPTDEAVAGNILNPASATAGALNAAIGTVSLPPPSGVDDTAAINGLLASIPEYTHVKAAPGAQYLVSAPIEIRKSGTTLDMSNATIDLLSGSFSRFTQSPQTPDWSTTASTTAGSTTVTTAAVVPASYVGHSIVIDKAGGIAPNAPISNAEHGWLTGAAAMHVRIVAINGTTLTIDRPANRTFAGVVANVYKRLRDIKLIGGKWNRRSGNHIGGHSITLHRVDGLEVRDISLSTLDSKYAFQFADLTAFWIHDLHLAVASDGVDINGPSYDGVIERIHGSTGDDTISLLSASEFAGDVRYGAEGNKPWGDLERITVRDIFASSTHHKSVNMSTSHISTIRDINIDGIFTETPGPTIKVMGWQQGPDPDGPDKPHGRISIRRVRGKVGILGSAAVLMSNPSGCELLTVEDVALDPGSTPLYPVYLDGPLTARLSNLKGNRTLFVGTNAVGSSVTVDGAQVAATSGNAVQLNASCYIELSNITAPNISTVAVANGAGVVVTARNHNVRGGVATWFAQGGAHLIADGDVTPLTRRVDVGAGSSVDSGVTSTDAKIASLSGTMTSAYSRNHSLRVDVSKLGMRAGDSAYNTLASLSCGVGPVLCDGTKWINEWTRSTYTPGPVIPPTAYVPGTPNASTAGDKVATTVGLISHWRAEGFTVADGTAIAELPARAGSAGVALTALDAPPTLLTAGPNGKKALRFTKANAQSMQAMYTGTTAQPWTRFIVFRARSISTEIVTTHNAGMFAKVQTNSTGNKLVIAGNGTSVQVLKDYDAITAQPWYIMAETMDGAASRHYWNALTPETSLVDATISLPSVRLGRIQGSGTTFGDVDIAEVDTVAGAMSDTAVKAALTDLATYYGITLGA